MRLLLSVTILCVSTVYAAAQNTTASQVVVQPAAPAPELQPTDAASRNKAVAKALTLPPRSTGVAADDLEQQAQEAVLVVPTPDLSPEALAAVSEDMAVMCRILDKALPSRARATTTFGYITTREPFGHFFGDQGRQTQGLYLDGYGALFFVQVDFPLVAPPQQAAQAQPQESADRVWSDTMNELRGQSQADSDGEAGPAYDARKIEDLKATLIKTLRHAANLRTRMPQDHIVLVVGTQAGALPFKSKQSGVHFYGRTAGVTVVPPVRGTYGDRVADGLALDPAGTLILRATKADVDAFAAGTLTLEQFTPKVQILWSTQPEAHEPASASPGPISR